MRSDVVVNPEAVAAGCARLIDLTMARPARRLDKSGSSPSPLFFPEHDPNLDATANGAPVRHQVFNTIVLPSQRIGAVIPVIGNTATIPPTESVSMADSSILDTVLKPLLQRRAPPARITGRSSPTVAHVLPPVSPRGTIRTTLTDPVALVMTRVAHTLRSADALQVAQAVRFATDSPVTTLTTRVPGAPPRAKGVTNSQPRAGGDAATSAAHPTEAPGASAAENDAVAAAHAPSFASTKLGSGHCDDGGGHGPALAARARAAGAHAGVEATAVAHAVRRRDHAARRAAAALRGRDALPPAPWARHAIPTDPAAHAAQYNLGAASEAGWARRGTVAGGVPGGPGTKGADDVRTTRARERRGPQRVVLFAVGSSRRYAPPAAAGSAHDDGSIRAPGDPASEPLPPSTVANASVAPSGASGPAGADAAKILASSSDVAGSDLPANASSHAS